MSFLKIGDLDLGATYNYAATPMNFDKKIRMADNTLVIEKRDPKWQIQVTYNYMTDAERKALYAALGNIPAGGVPVEFYNNRGELDSGFFALDKTSPPVIARFKNGVPDIWTKIGFTLEEV